jgi:hypothetical protein
MSDHFGTSLASRTSVMSTLKEMSGTPSPTPGAAEGSDDQDLQSKVPPSAHTPGSAEGPDLPEYDGEAESGEKPAET